MAVAGIGYTRRRLAKVRHRLAATDQQLMAMSSIIPLAALRARLEQRDFDVDKLRADIAEHPMITASNMSAIHGYRDQRDGIIEVRWPDGTRWRRP